LIYVYTDGSSTGGRGIAGHGWIVCKGDDVEFAGFGHLGHSTNNLAELEAAIQGLMHIYEYRGYFDDEVTLVSDSEYTLGIASGTYKPQKNIDSAEKLRLLAQILDIKTQWVRGHSGHEMNEIADSLAKMGKRGHHKSPRGKQTRKQKRKEMWK
jgi:ribonuclease HI